MPDMTYVDSSNIEQIGYDSDNMELHVIFKDGSLYVYTNVPVQIYEELSGAPLEGQLPQPRGQGRLRLRQAVGPHVGESPTDRLGRRSRPLLLARARLVPGLIIFDHFIDGPVTGLDAAPALKAAAPAAKILLFSAHDLAADARRSPGGAGCTVLCPLLSVPVAQLARPFRVGMPCRWRRWLFALQPFHRRARA